jgi:hypothetical protein
MIITACIQIQGGKIKYIGGAVFSSYDNCFFFKFDSFIDVIMNIPRFDCFEMP